MAKRKRQAADGVLRHYAAKDVIAYADIDRGQLTHWTDSGLITAAIRNERGSGKHRIFSFRNIVEARLAGELSQYGIPTRDTYVADIHRALDELRWTDLVADALLRAPLDPPTAPWGPQQISRFNRAAAIHFGSDRGDAAREWGESVGEAVLIERAKRWEALKDPAQRFEDGREFLMLSPWQSGVRLYFDVDPTQDLPYSGVIVRLRWILHDVEKATGDWWRPEDRVANIEQQRARK